MFRAARSIEKYCAVGGPTVGNRFSSRGSRAGEERECARILPSRDTVPARHQIEGRNTSTAGKASSWVFGATLAVTTHLSSDRAAAASGSVSRGITEGGIVKKGWASLSRWIPTAGGQEQETSSRAREPTDKNGVTEGGEKEGRMREKESTGEALLLVAFPRRAVLLFEVRAA